MVEVTENENGRFTINVQTEFGSAKCDFDTRQQAEAFAASLHRLDEKEKT